MTVSESMNRLRTQREALVAAADEIGRAAMEFAAKADGGTLAAIDPLLPTPDQYK